MKLSDARRFLYQAFETSLYGMLPEEVNKCYGQVFDRVIGTRPKFHEAMILWLLAPVFGLEPQVMHVLACSICQILLASQIADDQIDGHKCRFGFTGGMRAVAGLLSYHLTQIPHMIIESVGMGESTVIALQKKQRLVMHAMIIAAACEAKSIDKEVILVDVELIVHGKTTSLFLLVYEFLSLCAIRNKDRLILVEEFCELFGWATQAHDDLRDEAEDREQGIPTLLTVYGRETLLQLVQGKTARLREIASALNMSILIELVDELGA